MAEMDEIRKDAETYAAIDIGSNAVRLLIKQLESDISATEEEESRLNELLVSREVLADYKKGEEVARSLQTLREKLEGLYGEYEKFLD